MRNWKTAFFICLSLLIISNVYLVYQLLDSGITITYTSDTMEKQNEVIEILGEIIVSEGNDFSKKDVLFLLRQKYPNGLLVEDSNTVSYEGVAFRFEQDTLVDVIETWQ